MFFFDLFYNIFSKFRKSRLIDCYSRNNRLLFKQKNVIAQKNNMGSQKSKRFEFLINRHKFIEQFLNVVNTNLTSNISSKTVYIN